MICQKFISAMGCILIFIGCGLCAADGQAPYTATRLVESQYGYPYTARNGLIYFPQFTEATGTELWRSDGTIEGTRMIKDMYPGTGDGVYVFFEVRIIELNGIMLFLGRNPEHGYELWRTD